MQTKNTTIKPKNNHNKCFQHVAILALSHEEIGKNSGRLSQIKLFIDKYNWEGINDCSGNDDREMRKMIQQLLVIFYMLKNNIYIYIYNINIYSHR